MQTWIGWVSRFSINDSAQAYFNSVYMILHETSLFRRTSQVVSERSWYRHTRYLGRRSAQLLQTRTGFIKMRQRAGKEHQFITTNRKRKQTDQSARCDHGNSIRTTCYVTKKEVLCLPAWLFQLKQGEKSKN